MCVRVCAVPYREIRFRKCAQSADDEGSMELAESLQHLTLSEFLKEWGWTLSACLSFLNRPEKKKKLTLEALQPYLQYATLT